MDTAASDTSQTEPGLPTGTSPRHTGEKGAFWEDDVGLIVLEAEGSFFCARRAVLCQESQIFCDMLLMPQPTTPNAAEQYDGKPLVHLADSAAELQLFLEALHQYRLYYLSPESQTLSAKAAILRLSTKYEVPHLRERTINELSPYFPTTLAEYDKAMQQPIAEADFNILASAIEEADVRRFLPVVTYTQVCRTISIPLSPTTKAPSKLIIAASTLMFCQSAMAHVSASQLCRDLSTPQPYADSCVAYKDVYHKDMMLVTVLHPFASEPPFVLQPGYRFCAECFSDGRKTYHENRRSLWDNLPFIFGLPPWEELTKEQ